VRDETLDVNYEKVAKKDRRDIFIALDEGVPFEKEFNHPDAAFTLKF
jgi:hypothetical protein